MDVVQFMGIGGRMTRDEAISMMQRIRANTARLASCVGAHVFVDTDVTPYGVGAAAHNKYKRCITCDGVLSAISAQWYERGLQEAQLTKEELFIIIRALSTSLSCPDKTLALQAKLEQRMKAMP